MIRLKELQRRFDQMLGLPKVVERERGKYTINARLTRLEEQMLSVSDKLDECLSHLRKLQPPTTNLKTISNDPVISDK